MKLIAAALIVALGLAVAGCNTTEGVGKDIEATGEALQDVAN